MTTGRLNRLPIIIEKLISFGLRISIYRKALELFSFNFDCYIENDVGLPYTACVCVCSSMRTRADFQISICPETIAVRDMLIYDIRI